MQIRELEKELDVELIDRRPGDAALTEIGILVAKRGDEVLAATRDLVDFARHPRPAVRRRIEARRHFHPRALSLAEIAAASAPQGRHPDLGVKLRETQTKALVEELVAGDLTTP